MKGLKLPVWHYFSEQATKHKLPRRLDVTSFAIKNDPANTWKASGGSPEAESAI